MKKGKWLFLVLLVCMFGVGVWLSGVPLGQYVTVDALLLVNGMAIVVALAAHGGKGVRLGITAPFRSLQRWELEVASTFWRTIQRGMVGAAAFGLVTSTIAILVSTRSAGEAQFGFATAGASVWVAVTELLLIVVPYRGTIDERLVLGSTEPS